MISPVYQAVQERTRPFAVSKEAQFVRRNNISCQFVFIGQSVFIPEMYKQKLKTLFDFYNSKWIEETMFSSSVSEITNNSTYRSIIALGTDIIPFIIDDLKVHDSHWFYALEELTGINPIKYEHIGIVPLMKNDWLEWAENNI